MQHGRLAKVAQTLGEDHDEEDIGAGEDVADAVTTEVAIWASILPT